MPTSIKESVGHWRQRISGNCFEHSLQIVPLAVLIDFPAVEIEVGYSTLARDVLERTSELRCPSTRALNVVTYLISAGEVTFQRAVPKLNVCGASIGVGRYLCPKQMGSWDSH